MGLKAQLSKQGSVVVTSNNTPGNNPQTSSKQGVAGVPAIGILLTDGTGPNQAHVDFEAAYTIVAGGTLAIDMQGGTGELDVLNVKLALTCVKSIEFIVTGPTPLVAGNSLMFGPTAIAATAQLFFGGVVAADVVQVAYHLCVEDPIVGWPISVAAHLLHFSNPGAQPVSFWIRVLGY